MSNNNYIRLKGFLGKNPEFGQSEAGVSYASFTLAVSDNYYDKKSKAWVKAPTQWFLCVAFNPLEIMAANQIRKGSLVNIEGKIK